MSNYTKLLTCIGSAVLLAASAVGQVTRDTSVTGPNGKTASRDVTRTANSVSVTDQGPNGKTLTRDKTVSKFGSSSVVTEPDGKTASRTVARGDGTVTATDKGPNGGSLTRSRSRVRR